MNITLWLDHLQDIISKLLHLLLWKLRFALAPLEWCACSYKLGETHVYARTLMYPSQAVPTPWWTSMPMRVCSWPGGIGQTCSACSAQLTWQLKWHTAQQGGGQCIESILCSSQSLYVPFQQHLLHIPTLCTAQQDPLLHSPLHVIPCLTWPCMNEVQWSHFIGTSNERMTISWEVAPPLPCCSTRDGHTCSLIPSILFAQYRQKFCVHRRECSWRAHSGEIRMWFLNWTITFGWWYYHILSHKAPIYTLQWTFLRKQAVSC